MASKKKEDVLEKLGEISDRSGTYNPLLNALRENDKKHLFQTNVTTVFHKTGYPLFDYYFGSVINIHDDLGKIVRQEPRVGQAAGTFNLVIGNTGSGKMEPNSRKIPTPNGYKRMGDIKVGDKVFGSNGEPIFVEGVYPQGVKEIYKVTFSDGRYALCGKEHLWNVYTYSHGINKLHTLTLGEIMKDYKKHSDTLKEYRKRNNSECEDYNVYRYRVPLLSGCVHFNEQPVPIDPYVVGAFIGNGCLTLPALSISSGDAYVPRKIAEICNFDIRKNKCSYTYVFYDKVTKKPIKTKEFFKDIVEICSYSRDKIIPEIYLHNSDKNRMELLRGLMDTDGSIVSTNPITYKVNYSSTSKKLLEQIQYIIRSFGFGATISKDSRSDSGKYVSGFCGSLIFRIPNHFKADIFTHPRKHYIGTKCANIPQRFKYDSMYIKDIKLVGNEEATCIKVSAKDELYLTEDFIVTHNTTLASQVAANIIRQYSYSNVIHYDCENRFDISRCETITHLPASFFDGYNGPERYMIKTGLVGLDVIQEMIVKTYVTKMRLKNEMLIPSGFKNEFGKDIMIFQPTVIIIDSITSVINETFNPDNNKDASDAEKMRGNTEGARDAKTLKGFFKDILPLCKEANIIVYGINHINNNMSMNAFIPVAKQQNYLRQDESIPGGKTMLYYPFNIIKLTARPSDDFTEESDGFAGHIVMVEPIKSSSNQSGNNSKGVSFEMVFSFKYGFDPLRTMILYGKDIGAIEGNKTRMKFKEDDSFTFNLKNIIKEKEEKPIWENLKKFVFPHLSTHLSFIEPAEVEFDDRTLDY